MRAHVGLAAVQCVRAGARLVASRNNRAFVRPREVAGGVVPAALSTQGHGMSWRHSVFRRVTFSVEVVVVCRRERHEVPLAMRQKVKGPNRRRAARVFPYEGANVSAQFVAFGVAPSELVEHTCEQRRGARARVSVRVSRARTHTMSRHATPSHASPHHVTRCKDKGTRDKGKGQGQETRGKAHGPAKYSRPAWQQLSTTRSGGQSAGATSLSFTNMPMRLHICIGVNSTPRLSTCSSSVGRPIACPPLLIPGLSIGPPA